MELTSAIIDENETIHINRGDRLIFEHSIVNDGVEYVFQENDFITFAIYNVKKLDEEPLVFKKIIPNVGSTSVEINIPGSDMKIGEPLNKEKDYWYVIRLNDEVTTKGYDQNDAKILTLYPEGMKPNVES